MEEGHRGGKASLRQKETGQHSLHHLCTGGKACCVLQPCGKGVQRVGAAEVKGETHSSFFVLLIDLNSATRNTISVNQFHADIPPACTCTEKPVPKI